MFINVLLDVIDGARLHFLHVHCQDGDECVGQLIPARLADVDVDPEDKIPVGVDALLLG